MFARVVVEVLVVNPGLVRSVLVPFAAMAGAAALLAWLFFRRSAAGQEVPLRNPFSLARRPSSRRSSRSSSCW